MPPISYLLILLISFFFLSPLIAFASDSNDDHQQELVKLDLMHRHHPEVVKRHYGEMKFEDINDRVKDIHDHDQMRHRSISTSINRKLVEEKVRAEVEKEKETETEPDMETSPKIPIGLKMISGSDYGNSEYFLQLKVGTPPQTFLLIADTGSDLTWIRCRYRRCMGNCNGTHSHRIRNEQKEKFGYAFYANRSSSFTTIPCNTKMCSDDLTELAASKDCKTPTSPCRYAYRYTSGQVATGIFAKETLTVSLTNGKEKQLKDTIIGCNEAVDGDILRGADGLIGLGTSFYAFPFKVAEQSHSGGGFSYCLVNHLSNRSAISHFVLGVPSPQTYAAATSFPVGNATTTKLFIGDPYESYYGVHVIGISVDGHTLDIPPRVWDAHSGCGTILDSGTSLTMLTTPAYEKVMEALTPKLMKFERVKLGTFDFCFNNSLYERSMAPKLRFHFEDGAVFEPPADNYIISVGDYTCIGFVPMQFPSNNIIGNILQQNYLWQFDFVDELVSFAPSKCG